jgi:hypothetical protein
MNQLVRVLLPLEAYNFAVYYQEDGETLEGCFPDLANAGRRGDREAVRRWFDEHTVVAAAHRSDFDPEQWDGKSPINGWVLWAKAVIEKVGLERLPRFTAPGRELTAEGIQEGAASRRGTGGAVRP